jgi:hypothetical protein
MRPIFPSIHSGVIALVAGAMSSYSTIMQSRVICQPHTLPGHISLIQSQALHPQLDVAKQIGREILRPQLALAQKFPLFRWRVRSTVAPDKTL